MKIKDQIVQQAAEKISSEAVVVRISIGSYKGRVDCKKIATLIAERTGASVEAVEGKLITISRQRLQRIRDIEREARAYQELSTLQFQDGGYRLLKVKNFPEYRKKIAAYENKYRDAVSRLIADYDSLYVEAKQSLTDEFFNYAKFPSREKMERLFYFDVEVTPIPDLKEHRLVGLNKQEKDEIFKKVNENYMNRVRSSVDELTERIQNILTKIAGSGEGERGLFRDVFADHLPVMCRSLKQLNLSDDPQLDEILDRLNGNLAGLSAEKLRTPEAVVEAGDLMSMLKQLNQAKKKR